jgi:hypothetical protein
LIGDDVGIGRLSKDVPFQRETICVKAMLPYIDMTQLIRIEEKGAWV